MKWELVPAAEFMAKRVGSVNPANFQNEEFELFSIPAFDTGSPEVLVGSEIGSSKKCVEPDDVLLSRIVPHIRRCWVVPPASSNRQIASGEWITFRSKRVFPQYLKHYLVSDVFHQQFMQTVSGVGGSLLRARPSEVERIKIPLPPLNEQKRIAAILDKADILRRKRQQAIHLADQFLRAVFLEMFGDPVMNPKGLRKESLGDLIKVSSGSGLTASQMDPNGIYPVYGGNGVNGYHSEYMFEDEQIVIGRVGVYCGAVHVTEPNSWVTDNALYIKGYKEDMNMDYLAEALAIARLNQYAGKAAQPLVSGSRIYPVEILVPSLSEQEVFSSAKKKFNQFTTCNQSSVTDIKYLFNSISQRAFSGEL